MRLYGSKRINVLFLQETLGEGVSINTLLTSILPRWTFHTLDVRGRPRGCAIGFNNRTINIENIWGSEGVLGAGVTYIELDAPLHLINIYGPCHNRVGFWDKLTTSYFMDKDNIIIGGDLNLSLAHVESWGSRAQIDPMTEYFELLLDSKNLLNIDTAKIQPTW